MWFEVGHCFQDSEDVVSNAKFSEDAGFLGEVPQPQPGSCIHGRLGDHLFAKVNGSLIGFD